MSQVNINQGLGPTFGRGSNANKQDGTSVSGNIVRYENAATTPTINKQRLWDRGTHLRTTATYNVIPSTVSASFEVDSNADGRADGWSVNASGGNQTVALSMDSANAFDGAFAQKVVISGGTLTTIAHLQTANIPVKPGVTYTLSYYVKGSNADATSAFAGGYVDYYDATGAFVANIAPDFSYAVVSNGYTRVIAIRAMPANAYFCRLHIYVGNSGLTATTQTYYIDAAQVEEGSVATPFSTQQVNELSLSTVPQFVRPGNAYNQIGQSVANNTPRYGTTIDVLGATNLLLWSEQFDNAAWAKIAATITANATNDPNGNLTADKLVENSSLAFHQTTRNALTLGAPGTFSVYLKAAERAWAMLQIGGSYAYFNIASGFVGVTGGALTSSSVTNAGNGWYRCSITMASVNSNGVCQIFTANADNGANYTGDGSSGIYIWGAQAESNLSPTPYIQTTSAVVNRPTTYLQDSVLIEEGSTNIGLRSEEFDNAYWTKSASTITANTVYAPNGTLTADKIAEDNTTAVHYASIPTIATIGQPGSFSVYLKAAERSWAALQIGTANAFFNLATGTVGTITGAGHTASMAYVGDGWYRCTLKTSSVIGGVSAYVTTATGDTVYNFAGTTGNGVYAWGAQYEVKAYPTSYIPTTSVSVARSADVLTVPKEVMGVSSGAIICRAYVDGDIQSSTSTQIHYLIDFRDGSGNNGGYIRRSTTNTWTVSIANATTASANNTAALQLSTGWHTFGIRWAASRLSLYIDGVEQTFVNGSVNVPVAQNQLVFGSVNTSNANFWNNCIEEVNVFNSYLSDSDMTIYTAASGAVIPMRSETTWKAEFDGNLNFATSGVYVSEWFNVGASGAIFSGYSAPNNAASGCTYTYEFQMSDSDTQATTTAWLSAPSSGKYVRARITMVSTLNNSVLPTTTSLTITPTDTSKGITVEEGTANLFAAPAVPVAEEIAVTAGSSYTLSTYGVDASSGSVVIEHKKFEDTQADFNVGTFTNAQSLASGAIALTTHADPTFTRTTAATKRDGTQVQSGYTRYEDVIKNALTRTQGDWDAGTKVNVVASPGTYQQDVKRYESMLVNNSADWTSTGTAVATWTWDISNQRIAATSGTFANYTFNNFSAKDVSIEATSTQVQNGGLIARFIDANNYYLLLCEDKTAVAGNNFVIWKVVGGVTTSLIAASAPFTRGTSGTVRFDVIGNELKAYFNGTLISSVFDSSISSAGKCGFYANNQAFGTTSYFTSAKIAQLIPGGRLTTGQFVDGFDVDSSGQYTADASASSISAIWNTAQSRLETSVGITGTSFGSVVYNATSYKDVAIEASLSQAASAGLIARCSDKNNYYLMIVHDNTAAATNNIGIYKVVSGAATLLGSQASTTFVRGTSHTVRFEVIANELKAYFDGVLVTSITDSTYSLAGKVGMYSNNTTASYYNSFTIDQLSPLFSRPSVANKLTDGSSVARNLPRYENGRNILAKNQSDAEVDTTFFTTTNGNLTAGATMTRDTTKFWQGTASIRVDTTTSSAAQGIEVHPVTSKGGVAYTASVYVWCPTGTSLYFGFNDAVNGGGTNTTIVGNSAWQRASLTFTPTKQSTMLQAYVRTLTAIATTFYVDGLQMEEGSVATTWNAGGPSAIMIEEGTTNLMTAGAEAFGVANGWSVVGGGTHTGTTSGQADPFGGTSAYRVQVDATSGNALFKYKNATVGLGTTGLPYSHKVWVKNNDASNVVNVNSNSLGPSVNVANSDGWKLVKLENGLANGVSVVSLLFNTATNTTNLDVTLMYPQTEQKAYCTSYIAPGTTRAYEIMELPNCPASGYTTAGTIIIRAYFDGDLIASTCQVTHNLIYLSDYNSSNNQVRIVRSATIFGARISNSAGTTTLADWVPGSTITTGWHTTAIRWSSAGVSLWFDGVKKAETTTGINLPTSASNLLPAIGCNNTATQQWNYPIDEVNIFPVALSDADMLAYGTL